MKRILITLAVSLFAATSAMADAGLDLAKAKNCLACHAVDKKVVGPAYKDVAAKYAGKAGMVDKLAEHIMKGSQGVWGPIPMPANTQVNAADAKTLATWILAQKK
jgi:cytochrome c